jgi:hypothetical protein
LTAYVLVDTSMSTNSAPIRDLYLRLFEQVISGLPPGSRLVVDRVTADSQTSATHPINTILPVFDPGTTNQIAFDHSAAEEQARLISTFQDQVLAMRASDTGTDILRSVSGAPDIFSAFGGKDVLVVLTDARNVSPDASDLGNLDRQGTAEVLSRLAHQGLLPSLDGVDVYLLGVGDSAGGPLSPKKAVAVKRFWQAYVGATGATLVAYTLVPARFPLGTPS